LAEIPNMLIARCIELMFRMDIFQMPIIIHKCNNGFLFSRMNQIGCLAPGG